MQITLPAASAGILKPGELLTLPAFKERLGLTDSAVRAMRRNGLLVRRSGKRHFIAADDAIRHILETASIVE